jgi:hypothetical protein
MKSMKNIPKLEIDLRGFETTEEDGSATELRGQNKFQSKEAMSFA